MTDTVVRCYAGHRYPERPRAFLWEEKWLEVAEVEAQWHTPIGPAFHVRTPDDRRFTLAYNQTTDTWTIEHRASSIEHRASSIEYPASSNQ